MKALRRHIVSYSEYALLYLPLFCFILAFFSISGYCQLPLPYLLSDPFGMPLPNIPSAAPYMPLTQNGLNQIKITREFPPGLFNNENISLYIRADEPMSVMIGIISTNGHMFWIEAIPEDGYADNSTQGDRIIVHVGSEKLDGEWYEWEINSIDVLLEDMGQVYSFIARLDIRGKAFCLGTIAAFSEDENGERQSSYLTSFTDERDSIKDYGWQSNTPVRCEYYDSFEGELKGETVEIEEGYVCLSPDQLNQDIQTINVPVNFISPPLIGLGPFLPVTVFKQMKPSSSFPLFYRPPAFTPLAYTLASQLYSTPIEPGLAVGLIQSLPFYLNAQSGVPYSVKENIFQSNSSLPQYPASIDYNSPAYAYLGLE